MSSHCADVRVEVDPRNPGEFFACCGLLELADRLWPCGAEGRFSDGCFILTSAVGDQSGPLIDLLKELATTEPHLLENPGDDQGDEDEEDPSLEEATDDTREAGGANPDEGDGVPPEGEDAAGEYPEKGKPSKVAPLIVRSASGRFEMILDWWMRYTVKKKRLTESGTAFKTWAANATSRQMFAKWLPHLNTLLATIESAPQSLFSHFRRVQGSYGFDARAGWDALLVGFSLNEHSEMKEVAVSPALELLCAIGLQRFLPPVDDERADITYSTWTVPLSPPAARVAALGIPSTITLCSYRTRFTSRGSFKGLDFSSET